MDQIIVDAGPLVALVNRRDRAHSWCVKQLGAFSDPLLTCDAVLSEAFFLLKRHTDGGELSLCEMIQRGLVKSCFKMSDASFRVPEILKKYVNLPASFADACLVAMAEMYEKPKVWTLDSDFRIYRKRDRRIIPTIALNWI
ncbi:MAG: PIN domain-containing protein [Verrucomicrobia bacterium]|jgi:uncharacterized protein|nr:PIN domain-containing protein [Verrucomicrobiota bacterium]